MVAGQHNVTTETVGLIDGSGKFSNGAIRNVKKAVTGIVSVPENKKGAGLLQAPHLEVSLSRLVTVAAIATTTASATATATTATVAAGTRWAFFTGTGFINGQVATAKVLSVEGLNSRVSAFLGLHGDKREAARAAAEFVHDQIDAGHGAVGREEILEIVFGGVEGEVSYEQFSAHDDFTL
jgi:hypothetical protein